MAGAWTQAEVAALAQQFGLRPGCRLHAAAEDYHFPDRDFLAQGYAPPGGYVKDFSVVSKDERLHLFHIDGRPGEVCWITGNEISFGHASTSDFHRWIRHPMPLAVGDRPWESEHVWAPFVYRRDDLYYMFYMGHGREETFLSYATSTDLERWSRWEDGPIRCAVGRDPFVWDHEDRTLLLYTPGDGGRVAACASRDLVNWDPLPDLIALPGGAAAESSSLHPLGDDYVLWFNDYGPDLAGFRAAYAVSCDPFHFSPDAVREFRFETGAPDVVPSPELRVSSPVPLSLELIARADPLWLVAYFRWQGDRNRLFFGALDWSEDPAVIREITHQADLQSVLVKVGLASDRT